MSDNVLLVERDGRVAILTINRPEKLNAMSSSVRAAIVRTFKELEADDGIGAIVLTGAGDRAFCAGLDIKEVGGDERLGDVYQVVDHYSKPVVAAVNGLCLTGGLELMLSCDLSIASTSARFADTHVRVGLVPGSSGLALKLPYQIGLQRAKEMQLTGNYVSAERAFQIGLVNHVVEPGLLMKTALGLAHDLSDGNYKTMMAYKQTIDDGFQVSLGEGLKLVTERAHAFHEAVDSEDLQRAKAATMQRGRTQISS